MDNLEINACKEENEEVYRVDTDEEADFFTVYRRNSEGLAEAIQDFPSRTDAEAYVTERHRREQAQEAAKQADIDALRKTHAQLEPGKLYARLFHGRKDPNESLDDWGFDGPYFGPLTWFHMVYLCDFYVGDERHQINITKAENGCIEFEGGFYGDVEVFIHKEHR